jgi:Methyltransferase domain
MTSPDASHILSEFELSEGDGYHVFASECVVAAGRITARFRHSLYDHRPSLPYFPADSPFYLEQYRVGYACFKREVARVLAPKSILEIGIGCGIGALAMMDGAPPHTLYVGIDNNEARFPTTPAIVPTEFVSQWMSERGYQHNLIVADSQSLTSIPHADLVHVDGDHSREGARHDVRLAWESGAAWILCDDARDSSVCAGVFDALSIDLHRGSVEWAYFNDTWTGSVLIRTDHKLIGE